MHENYHEFSFTSDVMTRTHASLLLLGVLLIACCSSNPVSEDDRKAPLGRNGNSHTLLSEVTSPSSMPQKSSPAILSKLRDLSSEDVDEDEENAAKEEIDGQPEAPRHDKEDDNDADEHDDYEEDDGDYQGSLSILPKKPRASTHFKSRTALSHVPIVMEAHYYDEDQWPELLPAPMAQSVPSGFLNEDGTYVVNDAEGEPCVLAFLKARVTVSYIVEDGVPLYTTTKAPMVKIIKDSVVPNTEVPPPPPSTDRYQFIAESPPRDATVSGSCNREGKEANLKITWSLGSLDLNFIYDTIADYWFIDKFQFSYNTGKEVYEDSLTKEEVTIKNAVDKPYWKTPHARSFRCSVLHDIPLVSEDQRFKGTLHFDEVRVQAFSYGDRFKTPKHCMHRVHRDERVPFIVGCTLAGLTFLSIGIYGIIRYFKIKKVQYGTMTE